MNNTELETKIKEIIDMHNMFDMICAAKAFEPEYKTSDFYKQTKMSMVEVIKNAKAFYLVDTSSISTKIQNILDGLSVEKVNELLDKIGATFAAENTATMEQLAELQDFKEIVNNKD